MISSSVSLKVLDCCEVEAALACGKPVPALLTCDPKYIPRAPITPAERIRTIYVNPFKLTGFDFVLSILLDPKVHTDRNNLTAV